MELSSTNLAKLCMGLPKDPTPMADVGLCATGETNPSLTRIDLKRYIEHLCYSSHTRVYDICVYVYIYIYMNISLWGPVLLSSDT